MLSSQPPVTLPHPHPQASPEDAPAADQQLILQLARELFLRHARQVPALLLKDRNLALVCDEDDASAHMFCQAAGQLGARVSRIRPSLNEHSNPSEIHHTARLLGRLYAALEWPHLPSPLRAQLQREAGIPVYAGMSLPAHPLAGLARQLDIDASPEDKWRVVIQAVLLRDLG